MATDNMNKVVSLNSEPKDNLVGLISDWLPRLHHAQAGHYTRSEILYKRADLSGYALIVSTTIVTAMLFFESTGYMKAFLVFTSILSASLSGVVSFARFAEKAEQHRSAAGSYGKLRRQLEKLEKTVDNLDYSELDSKLKVLRIEWEYISQNAPLTPKKDIDKCSSKDN